VSQNTINSFVDIFVTPTVVFNRIKEKSIAPWWPLLLMVGSSAAITIWYFLSVDLYQFMEVSMLMSGQEPSPAELDQILQAETDIRISSAAIGSVSFVIIYLILALYFFLVAMLVAEDKIAYGRWMSVIAWGSLPSLLSVISMGVSYALTVPEFALMQSLDKTSLASVMGLTWEDGHFNVLSTITIGALWSYALYGVGFKALSRCSVTTAVVVGLIPPVLQFGLMSLA
jgi:hypothetical protein